MDTRNNSPLNISNLSAGTPTPTPWYKKKIILALFALVGIVTVASSAMVFTDYLGAKVAPGKKFKILGPSTLSIGQTAKVTWDASTAGTKKYPFEKIEYCYEGFDRPTCILLASVVPNNGSAVVNVPSTIPVSRGYLKLTARSADKKLVGSLVSTLPATATMSTASTSAVAVPVDQSYDYLSWGWDGWAVSSSEETASSDGPSADFVEPLDYEQLLVVSDFDVRVQLARTAGTSLGCQQWKLNGRVLTAQDWSGGQSPDLSSEPCK